jgi:hypothetical protein
MLALLSFCYAVGICESREIERAALKPKIGEFCGGLRPTAESIREFRRRHGKALEKCLAQVFMEAWRVRLQSRCVSDRPTQAADYSLALAGMVGGLEGLFAKAVAERIHRAVRHDGAANDPLL